ncbi:group II intron reverse transcriptase/maturase [Acanthopleuribacter pedis]
MRLPTPQITVGKLQKTLHVKAKAEPKFRFYSLWDKVCRTDVLLHAYAKCRRNKGSAGIDGVTFEAIENQGLGSWLGKLREELLTGHYGPEPLRRVWIPKSNGKLRPLSIPCVRDRVVQQAALLILEPIFEADLLPEQYGFRKKRDAKAAVRRVYFHITEFGRKEVVDADLKDYFTTIPHGRLMKCVARRISDGKVLSLIKRILEVPVVEKTRRGKTRTAEAKKLRRGVPQGGVISPLLSNLYFRRFLLAWKKFGFARMFNAQIVNYADDLVICCKPGSGSKAREQMERLIKCIGLEVNREKTKTVMTPVESFDFLGYTFGLAYNKKGKPYFGTKPSKKALQRLVKKIHDETSRRWLTSTVEKRVAEINAILRGWVNYFNQGPVIKCYDIVRQYTEKRLRRWLVTKHKQRGKSGYRLYPDELLYGKLGLYKLPRRMADVPRAKT